MNKNSFQTPPISTNPSGEERNVGFEFEFTGVEMEDAAGLLKNLYDGNIERVSAFEYEVTGTSLGTFVLELDAQLLREKKYEKLLKTVGIDVANFKNIESVEDSLKEIAASVVPYEIITPPVPLSRMNELNNIVDELRKKKAKGTGSSIIYAFGLHINPEIPDNSAESLLNHLRAYVMLDPWIRKDADINISRRLTPFINEYKDDYILHILDEEYRPALEHLIRDYFIFENSRNRPLDLLPVFMYLDQELTMELLNDTLTSARPTYHYRLPNCSLEDENWSLALEWNRWVLVEKMAANETVIKQYSKAYIKMKNESLIRFQPKWIELMNRWIDNVG